MALPRGLIIDRNRRFKCNFYIMATNISSSGLTITLGGGFSPISGIEFLGQSEAKGIALYKCQRLFNVRETQKPGENFVITGRILKSTSVKETWNIRFDIDPLTRKVINSWCSCYVGSTGRCKHCSALFKYINSERPEGKTDKEQKWTTPSRKSEERFPKGETVQQMFQALKSSSAIKASSASSVVIQKDQPDFCDTLKADLERFGLKNSSLFKSLAAEPEPEPEEDVEQPIVPSDLDFRIRQIFHYGGMLNPQQKCPKMSPDETAFFQKYVVVDDKKRESIFCETIGQYHKKKWHDERELRISASKCQSIANAQKDETLFQYFSGSGFDGANLRYDLVRNQQYVCSYFICTRMSQSSHISHYYRYGRDTEAEALEEYKAIRNEAGDACTYFESGLVISRHYPWLCGSPDHLVVESNGDLTVIEIKCPTSGASGTIKVKYLKGVDGHEELKKGDPYYAQVQLQLMACDAKKTHFFVYARPGEDGTRRSKMLTIYRDDVYI